MARLDFDSGDITDADGSDGAVAAGGFKFELTSGSGALSFAGGGLSFVEASGNAPFSIAITRLDGSTFTINDGSLIYNGSPGANTYAILSGGGTTGSYPDIDFTGNPNIAVPPSTYGPSTIYTLSDQGSFGAPNPDSNIQIDFLDYTINSTPPPNAPPSVASILRDAGSAEDVPASASSVSYTVTFSEAVTGVDANDFTLVSSNSASGSIASVSGSGTTYTVVVDMLAGDGTLRLDLNSSGTGIVDGASAAISGGYTAGQSFTLDHTAPTTTPASVFAFSVDTGASSTDLVTNVAAQTISGTLSAALVTGESVQVSLDNGATWTNATSAVGSDTFSINATLAGSGMLQVRVVDQAGNAGTALAQSYVLDTTAPATPTATLAVDTGSSASDGVTNLPTVNVGSVEGLATFEYSTDSGVSWTTGSGSSFDLTSGTYAAGQVLVRQTDLAGNVSLEGSLGEVVVDTTAPTASIVLADPTLTVGEASLVTFTFSEKVAGFTGADLTIENGTLSNVTTADGGLTWTASFTPTVNVSDATNTISLDLAGVTDVAGNAGTGQATSSNYTIDTTVTLPPSPPPVTSGTPGDDTVTAGTLTTPIFGGAGADTITSTPLAGTTAHLYGGNGFLDPNDAGDTISITGGGAADVYGNGGDDVITFNASGVANIFGGVGDDRITITNGADNAVTGGPGGDTIAINGNGSNLVVGGTAIDDPNDDSDTIRIGGNGNNTVYANGGNDTVIITGSGNNTVYGGFGDDTITGGSGNDVLVGGPGANVLKGGGGADRFVHAAGGRDIIQDFSFAQGDKLDLGGQAYTVTSASDGSAALVFKDGGVIILQGVTEAGFQSAFVA